MTGYDPWDFCGKEELVLHGKSQVKFPKTWNIIYHKNNNLVIYSFYPTIKIVWSTNWRTDNDFQTVTCAKLERYDHWLVIYHLYYMSSHITSWNEHCFILKSSCRNSVSNIFFFFFTHCGFQIVRIWPVPSKLRTTSTQVIVLFFVFLVFLSS